MLKTFFKSRTLPSYIIQNSSFVGVLILYQYLLCRSQCDEPEAYNPSGWTNKFSIDSVVRNFRVFSCYHDFVSFIIFIYSNTQFPDKFKQ